MKFSGNVSFADIMILSQSEIDCKPLTNLKNFHNIGRRFVTFTIFWSAKNAGNFLFLNEIENFLQILLIYIFTYRQHKKSLSLINFSMKRPSISCFVDTFE